MSCEVAALPFQAYANYGTWAIDVRVHGKKHIILYDLVYRNLTSTMLQRVILKSVFFFSFYKFVSKIIGEK